jgi:hypothetical protein
MFDRLRTAPAAVPRRRRNAARPESRRRRHLSSGATEVAKIATCLVWRGHDDPRRYGVAELFLSVPPGSSSTPSNNHCLEASQPAQPSFGFARGTGNHLVHRKLYPIYGAKRKLCQGLAFPDQRKRGRPAREASPPEGAQPGGRNLMWRIPLWDLAPLGWPSRAAGPNDRCRR